jgi:hypothetical protein
MPLSFSQYKKTLLRSKCQITGDKLPEDVTERSVWVKDKTKPVCKDNIICTTKTLANSLDKFEAESKMSFIEMKKVFKGLVKY